MEAINATGGRRRRTKASGLDEKALNMMIVCAVLYEGNLHEHGERNVTRS